METGLTGRIGILGGTFNPVHLGHLIIAQDALENFELHKVLFVPCAQPPHKNSTGLQTTHHRLQMLEAALEGDTNFEISDIELQRGGVSYTVDTIHALKRQHPQVAWVLILGADSLLELHLWKDVYRLLALCEIVTLARPGFEEISEESLHLRAPWPERLRRNVRHGHGVEISSTDIRRRVAEGMSIRFLVPSVVEMYIAEHRLYGK